MFSNGSSLVKMHRNVNQVLDPEALPNTLSIFSTFYRGGHYVMEIAANLYKAKFYIPNDETHFDFLIG